MILVTFVKKIFAGESLEPPPAPGLLVFGGQSKEEQLTSVETFGFESCTIPSLPETRYSFGAFLTPTKPQMMAVCGGWWMGKPNSSDCLTLNVASGQWERGTFSNGVLGDAVRGVINIEGEGVFMVHNEGISVLVLGNMSWVTGPMFSTPAECGCKISSTSFVTIHLHDIHNVQEYIVKDGEAQPEPKGTWPSLVTKRSGPGCGATKHHLVVAGGVSDFDEVLTSVEVFRLSSKSLRRGGNLRMARAFFQIIPLGSTRPRLLAVGGHDANSTLDSSEWWDEEENSWEDGLRLSTGRAHMGVLMAQPDLVCAEVDSPPAHSCPAAENSEETCTFSNTKLGDSVML